MEDKLPVPPEDLKFIAPFLDRARELRQREPVVAYWCTYYAAKLALAKGSKSKESQHYLGRLLDALEEEKKALAGNEAVANDTVAYARVENFALKIFLNADNEDRQGLASKKTAKTFLAASIFLEVLKTFGEVDAEVEEKIKYSKWKAMDIMKCLREGRTPAPGPPGGEQPTELPPQDTFGVREAPNTQAKPAEYDQPHQLGSASGDVADFQNFPATPTTVVSVTQWQPTLQHGQSRPHPFQQQDTPAAPSPLTGPQSPHGASSAPYPRPPASTSYPLPPVSPGFAERPQPPPPACSSPSVPPPALDHKVVAAASKHARFVISALQYDDVKTAVENLRKALELLEPYNAG